MKRHDFRSSALHGPTIALMAALTSACPISGLTGQDAGGSGSDAGTQGGVHPESEPNNGTTLDEVNAIEVGWVVEGVIQTAGDSDIFKLDTAPGRLVRAILTILGGSKLEGNLTVMDSGRGTDPAGEDYVKLAVGGSEIVVEFVSMGQGGYFLAVRDQGKKGGADYAYELTVESSDAKNGAIELSFSETIQESLASAGAIKLYSFTAAAGTDLLVNLIADNSTPPEGMDGRLIVYSVTEQSWIARNDDRSASNVNPKIDAPLYAEGEMILVVENILETASDLVFSLTAELP